MKLYKNKYLIGVYSPLTDGETLLGLCNNIKEFADFMKIKSSDAGQILRMLFSKQTRYIRFHGILCTVEFIPDVEE